MATELLTTRDLGKAFARQAGLGQTIARRLRNLGRPPELSYVFRHVDFSLRSGECVALVGGNGSGKSTFLRCLGGVLAPTEGQITQVDGVAALLSHGFGAYEDLAVGINMTLAQQLVGARLADARARLAAVAETSALSDRLYGSTSHLSEGMRAKVALGALAHTPFRVALLDETLNHVDTEFKDFYFRLTRDWIAEGRALVMTSHDDNLLDRFATRKLRFENGTLVAW
jgi:ABC-2 type transport system ATP-binding protein